MAFILVIFVILSCTISHFEYTLSSYLVDTLQVSENYVSYMFGIRALAYGCMSMTTSKMCSLLSRRLVICIGILLIGVANAFMGSSKILDIPRSISAFCVGIAFNGVGCSFIFVSCFPELVTLALSKIKKANDSTIIDRAAGVYFTIFNTGYAMAPVISGYLVYKRDFEYSCNVMFIIDVILMLVFFMAFIIYKDRLLQFSMRNHIKELEGEEEE